MMDCRAPRKVGRVAYTRWRNYEPSASTIRISGSESLGAGIHMISVVPAFNSVAPRCICHREFGLDEAGMVQKFGVSPESIPDYLALVGDAADGYPGLAGWGAKSSAAVLAKFVHVDP